MAFTITASTWNDEHSDKSEILMTPILAPKTMKYLNKYANITGYNVQLPTFETTTPWQAGTGCGFTTSGTTTIAQKTITTVPMTINESICLNDLETYFTTAWLDKGSKHESFDIVDLWVKRKQAQVANQLESAIWQAKTTTTNATHLKQFNGLISLIDTAGTAIAATQQASISPSTVRGIFEEIIFQKLLTIPQILQNTPVVYCGMDTYMILMQKLMVDNLYHYNPVTNVAGADYEFTYPGTNVQVIALPGLNASNAVDTGVLPTAVKNRIFATYKENFNAGFNAENDVNAAKVWFSDDADLLRLKMRFHFGVSVNYINHVVQYTNI
jgi:hypothetical protein